MLRRAARALRAREHRVRRADALLGVPPAGSARGHEGPRGLLPGGPDLQRGAPADERRRAAARRRAGPGARRVRHEPAHGAYPGRRRELGLRRRRRLLSRRDRGALVRELPDGDAPHRGARPLGPGVLPDRRRSEGDLRPLDGRSRRADPRTATPGALHERQRLRADRRTERSALGTEGVRRLPRGRPHALARARRVRARAGAAAAGPHVPDRSRDGRQVPRAGAAPRALRGGLRRGGTAARDAAAPWLRPQLLLRQHVRERPPAAPRDRARASRAPALARRGDRARASRAIALARRGRSRSRVEGDRARASRAIALARRGRSRVGFNASRPGTSPRTSAGRRPGRPRTRPASRAS